jgi:hypothetical protein
VILPRPAPALTVSDLQGTALSWDSFRGKVVLVDFWATWCVVPAASRCRAASVCTTSMRSADSPSSACRSTEGGPQKVQKLVDSKKFTYPMALDSAKEP